MAKPGYFEQPRPVMMGFVPPAARRILDIGCGAGAFVAGLRRERAAAGETLEAWGIELDETAAQAARANLDEVLAGDVMTRLPELPDSHFDCVVLNDILEHLIDPEALLTSLPAKIAPGGCLVASIPNVRYFPHLWSVVVDGRWEYGDEGILDRTHLRFFTRSSMGALFPRCGYRLRAVSGINPTGSWKFRLFNLLTLGSARDMRFLQFACVAEPVRKS